MGTLRHLGGAGPSFNLEHFMNTYNVFVPMVDSLLSVLYWRLVTPVSAATPEEALRIAKQKGYPAPAVKLKEERRERTH